MNIYDYFINGVDNDEENGKLNCNGHKYFEILNVGKFR